MSSLLLPSSHTPAPSKSAAATVPAQQLATSNGHSCLFNWITLWLHCHALYSNILTPVSISSQMTQLKHEFLHLIYITQRHTNTHNVPPFPGKVVRGVHDFPLRRSSGQHNKPWQTETIFMNWPECFFIPTPKPDVGQRTNHCPSYWQTTTL